MRPALCHSHCHTTGTTTHHFATLATMFVKASFSRRKSLLISEMGQFPENESGDKKWYSVAGVDKGQGTRRLDSGEATRMADRQGDWAGWLDRHGAALVLLARQWVATHADAEDVVQEAFVRFWRSRSSAADPAAYLFACVRNCARDRVRGEVRRVKREAAVATPEAEPAFAAPVEQAERVAAIEAALRGLPEEQREVLVMKIWGGLTFVQIGTALAIAANTAGSRYRYALERLRKELAEEATR